MSLNVDTLTNLTYVRSKFWSELLEEFAEMDDDEELGLDEIEKVFDDNEDEAYISRQYREAEEVEMIEDEEFLEEITNLSLMKNNQTVINDEQHQELCEILNETMPILNEHGRQLKANGVEKILNTFDAKKIEEKVGGWIKKTNSKIKKRSFNNNYLQKYNKKYRGTVYHEAHENGIDNEYENRDGDVDADEDDSFESIDEANYIRKCKESSLPSSRNKLKDKINKKMKNNCKIKKVRKAMLVPSKQHHSLEQDDYYLKYILLKSQISQSQVKVNPYNTLGLSKNSMKIFRKRTKKNDIERSDTETDSDAFEDKNVKRFSKKYTYKADQRSVDYQGNHSISSSSTSFDSNSSCRNILQKPSYKKYVADSSMSDWIVEECSPQERQSDCNLVSNKPIKNSAQMKTPKSSKKVSSEKNIRKTKQSKLKSKKSLNEEIENVAKTASDEEYEKQLKAALKESKKQYRTDLKLKQNAVKTRFKTVDGKKSINDNETKSRLDVQSNITDSVSEKSKNNYINNQEPNISSIKHGDLIENKTFFNVSRNIVNSTALSNHSFALQKQFETTNKKDATTTVTTASTTSTATPTSPVSSTVPDNKLTLKEHKNSSLEKVSACTTIRAANDSSPVSSTSDLTKGIVIYTPKCDSVAKNKNSSYFSVTKEHLSSVLGETKAEKFFKYYVGRRIFNGNSTVYYKPPENNFLRLNVNHSVGHSSQNENTDNASDEEDDILENFGKYGELYESIHTD